MTAMTPDRRTVLAALAAGAALGPALAAAKEKPFKGLIIDALGGVGDPNPSPDDDPAGNPFALGEEALSERGVNDAIASGLTAFNLTLGYVAGEGEPFEHT
ncbi:MAG: peptidase M19, partial [Caulobacterales bacterium]|nr:peptidase M19 [Caulobacterales bacterium]